MIRRLSIFSFSTLHLSPAAPRGILFALLLLAGVEAGVRGLVHAHVVQPDPSLRTTIERRIDLLQSKRPSIWLIGNSTLDWGVNTDELQRSFGLPMIKLPHGSATLRATAAMLQYYIDLSGQKPQRVIVTLTKDDLNTNGSRADFSQSYLNIAASEKLPSSDWLMLRRARSNLRAGVIELIRAVHQHPAPAVRPVATYDGTPLTAEFSAYGALIKDYHLDGGAFRELRTVCDRNGLPPPIVVLMPVTDQYLLFHDRLTAIPKTAQIRARVLQLAKACEMPCIDYVATPHTDYSNFRDPYHLNPRGAEAITQRLAVDLKPLLAEVHIKPN